MSNTITLQTPISQLTNLNAVNVEWLLNKFKNMGLLESYLKRTKKVVPYIETDEYKNDPVVFSGTVEDGLSFLKNNRN